MHGYSSWIEYDPQYEALQSFVRNFDVLLFYHFKYFLQKYMYKYGYMEVPNNPVSKMPKMTSEKMIQNIKKMQMMMGIPMTGELDALTMMMVDKPRCGVHDPANRIVVPDNGFGIQIETSSYIFMRRDERWPRNSITYRYVGNP